MGEPACLMDHLCPVCGAYVPEPTAAPRCPACGTDITAGSVPPDAPPRPDPGRVPGA